MTFGEQFQKIKNSGIKSKFDNLLSQFINLTNFYDNGTTRILFNEDCPICNAEICHYQKYAEANDIELYFDQLGKADLSVYGVNKDQAAKRLHVISDGKILHGLPAFRAIWTLMPRYKLLAIVTNIPVIREIATFTYDKILAPILYKSHLRRQAKKAKQT